MTKPRLPFRHPRPSSSRSVFLDPRLQISGSRRSKPRARSLDRHRRQRHHEPRVAGGRPRPARAPTAKQIHPTGVQAVRGESDGDANQRSRRPRRVRSRERSGARPRLDQSEDGARAEHGREGQRERRRAEDERRDGGVARERLRDDGEGAHRVQGDERGGGGGDGGARSATRGSLPSVAEQRVRDA